ncbi:MAG: urease accessory protein UreD [Dongiaceae bacterium]
MSPLRVLFPIAADGDPVTAALINTGGGLVGGDSLSIKASIGPDAAALLVAQAAEKVYRSTGADCRIDVSLAAAPGAWLEMLPQETILFDGARLRRRTRIDAGPGAAVLAGEIQVFGRLARGEEMRSGLLHDAWQIRRAGQLIWQDSLHLDGAVAERLDHPAAFGGARVAATLIHLCEDPAAALSLVRETLAESSSGRASASLVNGVVVARWLGRDPLALRSSFAAVWIALRAAKNFPATLPRLWHI